MSSTNKRNKVKFNICNVHYAPLSQDNDGKYTWGDPVALPGAVSLSLDPQGEPESFYADGIEYYVINNNQGYDGDLEVALIPESFRRDILMETTDANSVLLENAASETGKFALLFEFDGDVRKIRHVLYNCSASRPSISAKTNEENREVQTETLTVKARPLSTGYVKAKTGDSTKASVYNNWYKSVYQTDEIYRVPVRLTELSKGELMEGGGGLVCDVAFLATGLFYKSVTRQSGVLSIGGKVYPYTYNYSYAEVSQNTLVIDSDSYEDSPCKITIFGPCLNPVWKHYVDNELFETGRYEGLIMADHKLVVDATGIPYSITERGAADDIVADRYQFCDFTTERFFHLKHGSNRISVSHDGLNTVKMMVEGKISYETV